MNTESSTSIVFYYSFALLFTSVIFFPSDFVIPDAFNLTLALSLGIMGSLGHYFMSQAAKNADVAVTSPLIKILLNHLRIFLVILLLI